MNPVVRFSHVGKTYDNLQVLTDISFDVYEEDVVGIFGPSGSGKTTILKLTANLIKPTSGTITTGTGRIGYVFQEPRMLPWRTALDNVALTLRARGLDSDRAREKAAGWLAKMGLEGFRAYFPSQLSGGMVQRISLARAFAVEPDVLLLDEPFGALDVNLKGTMISLIQKLLESQPVTVLYVSHVPEEVVRIATRIFVLASSGVLKEMPVMDHDTLVKVLKDSFMTDQ